MPVKLLAKFLGLLNLCSRALGQIVRLMTRCLYACLHPAYFSEEGWGASTSLSDSAKEEIQFWELNIEKLKGFLILPVVPSIRNVRSLQKMPLERVYMQLTSLMLTILFILGNFSCLRNP